TYAPLFILNPHSSVPIYQQLIEQVRRMVGSGQLAPGTELPSVRDMAQIHTVQPMTISQAYSPLESDGLLERPRGKPSRVAAPRHGADRHRAPEEHLDATQPARIRGTAGATPRQADARGRAAPRAAVRGGAPEAARTPARGRGAVRTAAGAFNLRRPRATEEETGSQAMSAAAVETSNLTKSFGKREVLHAITTRVQPG